VINNRANSLHYESRRIDLIENLNSLTDIVSEINPRFVINAAGVANVELCEANRSLAYDVNVLAAVHLAQACHICGVKFVQISTDHLFDGKERFSDEGKFANPLNYYAKTKLLAEEGVLNTNPDALVVRTNFFGWGTSYRNSFSDFIIMSLRNGSKINLFSDVYFTPILVETLAENILELLKNNASGIFNVVGNERMSKFYFGLKICDVFGLNPELISPISIEDHKGLIKRPKDMSLSSLKLERLIGSKMASIEKQIEILFDQERSINHRKIRSL
jgi:dTDP-4-dehydrorhamnose reductase